MHLTFLSAPVSLTKCYVKTPSGNVEKTSYPNVWQVTTHPETAKDLRDLERLIIQHGALGHCLLKGNVMRQLVDESRANSTDRNAQTDWLCLDFDGIDSSPLAPSTVPTTVDSILTAMGLGNVSYVLQWSASMGMDNNNIRCHVFIRLAKPMAAPLIKQWLIQMNHEVAVLREHQRLTKTGNALLWGLDITACQNDKLIYIADPVLKGLRNPLGKTPRVSLITKTHETYDITSRINGVDQNRALTDARVMELRDMNGLPKRKIAYKIVGPHEVMVKPGECIVTEMKVERGFVYFNLNGGDSWGYYHPESNPDFIFSFKGEPTYLTKELLPSYWETLQTQAYRVTSSGLIHLAFLDVASSTYFRGTYDPGNDVLDINPARTEGMVRQYADANGMRLGPNIPEWHMVFDPSDSMRVDFDKRTVNTFERTEYMKAPLKKITRCPPKILSVISHVLADDQPAIDHFINWLAVLAQTRDRTRTAWVLQGTQGTGKGILFERILAPLFGENQTVIKRSAELNEKWTDFVEGKFIVFIDEIQTSALHDESGAIANLKSLITNPTAMIRVMQRNAYRVRNASCWIFASNKPDPVTIPKNDRRFNVGPRQDIPFPKPTDEWLDSLEDELLNFYHFLMCYAANKELAATPLDNDARNTLIALSQTTAESTATALQEGDIQYFIDQLPTDDKYKLDINALAKVSAYRRTLFDVMSRTRPNGACNITRDELFVIFDYTVGNMNPSPTSFTKYLGHRQIEVQPIFVDMKTVRGISNTWTDPTAIAALLKAHFSDLGAPATNVTRLVRKVK